MKFISTDFSVFIIDGNFLDRSSKSTPTHSRNDWNFNFKGCFPKIKGVGGSLESTWKGYSEFKLTPTEVKSFLARFSNSRNLFNVLDYQNGSKLAKGSNSTHSTIWIKKWGSEKFLIFRPLLALSKILKNDDFFCYKKSWNRKHKTCCSWL